MADSSLTTGILAGICGAIAVKDYHGAQGTDWGVFSSKLFDSFREFDGFLQSAVFIIGKAVGSAGVGINRVSQHVQSGTVPSTDILDRKDLDQSIDAGRRGLDFLFKGGKLAFEALLEGARVSITRILMTAESSKEVLSRNLPAATNVLSEVSSSFSSGYQGVSAPSSYAAPSYAAPSYAAPSYAAPSYAAPSYTTPSYDAPAPPSYGAPAYSAPQQPAPSYTSPTYSAPPPAAPSYTAPSEPAQPPPSQPAFSWW